MSKFLNIEPKEDSLQQSQAVAGLPTKFKYSASEWNLIVSKINTLYGIVVGSDLGQGADNNITIPKITVFVNEQTPGALTDKIAAAINSLAAFAVTGNQLFCIEYYRNQTQYQTTGTYNPEIHRWFLRLGKGNYGSGGTSIPAKELLYLGYTRDSYENNKYNLGEIGTTPIQDVINSANQSWQSNPDSHTIFEATRNNEAVAYLYFGQATLIGDDTNPESSEVFENEFSNITTAPPLKPTQNICKYTDLYTDLPDLENSEPNPEDFAVAYVSASNGSNLSDIKVYRAWNRKWFLASSTGGSTGPVTASDVAVDSSLLAQTTGVTQEEVNEDFDTAITANEQQAEENRTELLNLNAAAVKTTAQSFTAAQQKQARENTKSAEKYGRVSVSASRNLAETDNGKLLLIGASVTLTFPATLPTDFNFNYKVLTGGQATFANGSKTIQDTEGNVVTQLVADTHAFGTCFEVANDTFMFEGTYN